MKQMVKMVARLFINSAAIALVVVGVNAADKLDTSASDPLNATYLIEDKAVGLVDGCSEPPVAPDSATKVRTVVWKQPVYSDLYSGGDEDATLLLTHDRGGIVVDYADRHPAEPMIASPSADKTMVLLLDKNNCSASGSLGEEDILH